jgi:1,4-dihydroxy-2-naphthoate octaprenyltransferase
MSQSATLDVSKKSGLWRAWFLAARPRTLPISFVPILVGTALASGQVAALNWALVVFTLLCSLFIQIGTNIVNDALDFKQGADGEGRLGPQRVTASGLLPFKTVLMVGCSCLGMALLCGIPLMLAGGWPLVTLLGLSVACAYLYTGGPFPLAYTGCSDIFVLLFFGWGSTCAVYYLQTGTFNLLCFLAATQIGLLAIVPHAINNLRDHVSDARVNKRSLAVRFGPRFARWEITGLSVAAVLLGLLWAAQGYLWMTILPLLSLPLIVRNVAAIWQTEPSPLYNQFLANSAICQFLFGALLALGYLFS